MARKKKSTMQWYKMDLHLHTPASADWHEPGVGYFDLLHQAEMRGLDILAITDHNNIRLAIIVIISCSRSRRKS